MLFVLFSSNATAQHSFGFGLGGATTNSMLIDFKYYYNKNAFSVGLTYEFNDSNGKQIEIQLPNHGKSISGTGEYFTSLDLGYTRSITESIFLSAEISFINERAFTNYIDRRFTSGGYHMINSSEDTMGYGGKLTYFITSTIGVYTGYNTYRLNSFGIDFKF